MIVRENLGYGGSQLFSTSHSVSSAVSQSIPRVINVEGLHLTHMTTEELNFYV